MSMSPSTKAYLDKMMSDKGKPADEVEPMTAPPVEEAPATIKHELRGKKLPAGMMLLSKMMKKAGLKGVIPAVCDIPLPYYDAEKWDESVRGAIPAISDFTNHIPDWETVLAVATGVALNKVSCTVGPTGAGKTVNAKFLCALMNMPVFRFQGKPSMEMCHVVGQPWMHGDGEGMEFNLGPLPLAMTAKYDDDVHGCMFLWDEYDRTPSEIDMVLQSVLEGGDLIIEDKPGTIADKTIPYPKGFRITATGNTRGAGDDYDKYNSAQLKDNSTLDRFGVVWYCNYLIPNDEIKMVKASYPEISGKVSSNLIKFANLIREGWKGGEISYTFSPRAILNVCEYYNFFDGDMCRAINMAFMQKLPEVEQGTVKSFYQTVFSSTFR